MARYLVGTNGVTEQCFEDFEFIVRDKILNHAKKPVVGKHIKGVTLVWA